MGFQCLATGAATGQCLPQDQGGCCSVDNDRNGVWLHLGIGATVLGLIVRRRRRRH
jgi:MYXO-CTERM domain-containing protein